MFICSRLWKTRCKQNKQLCLLFFWKHKNPHTVWKLLVSHDLIPFPSQTPRETNMALKDFKLVFPSLKVHAAEEWPWWWLRKSVVCPRRTSYIQYTQHTISRACLFWAYLDAGWSQFQLSHWALKSQRTQNRNSVEVWWCFWIVSSCVHANYNSFMAFFRILAWQTLEKTIKQFCKDRTIPKKGTVLTKSCKNVKSMKGLPKVTNWLEECPDRDTPVPQCLETSLWGSGGAVQSRVVNQNESRDLGNTNTNIILLKTTALAILIKTKDLPSVHKQNSSTQQICVCAHAFSSCVITMGVDLCLCRLMHMLVPFCAIWHDSQHHSSWFAAVLHSETQKRSNSLSDMALAAPSCSWQAPGIFITL